MGGLIRITDAAEAAAAERGDIPGAHFSDGTWWAAQRALGKWRQDNPKPPDSAGPSHE